MSEALITDPAVAEAAKKDDAGRLAAQGAYVDPIEVGPPDRTAWSPLRAAVWESPVMQVFSACLRLGDLDVRDSVLDDLASYHNVSPEEARRRCIHWEQWSVEEWRSGDRSTLEGLQSFYDTVESWAYDLLWHSYLQVTGHAFPSAQMSARFALERFPTGGAHLDFGSGAGTLSQLFVRLGFNSTSADVCKPLLDFAQWRTQRHGDAVAFINLTRERLPENSFDVVTAVDALVHVGDFDRAVSDIHKALRPGGWLLANFDVRARDHDESAWHLYHDELSLLRRVERAGFVQRDMLHGHTRCYQRLDRASREYKKQEARALVLYPWRQFKARARRFKWW